MEKEQNLWKNSDLYKLFRAPGNTYYEERSWRPKGQEQYVPPESFWDTERGPFAPLSAESPAPASAVTPDTNTLPPRPLSPGRRARSILLGALERGEPPYEG